MNRKLCRSIGVYLLLVFAFVGAVVFFKDNQGDKYESLRRGRTMQIQTATHATIIYSDMGALVGSLKGIVKFEGAGVSLIEGQEGALREIMPDLVYNAANNPNRDIKEAACWLIIGLAPQMGVIPASGQQLYEGLRTVEGQAMPKINVRAMGANTVAAILEAAEAQDSVFMLEVAASELGYIFDGLALEHTAVALGTAIVRGYRGPMFFSGDHCQVKKSLYEKDPGAAFAATEQTIRKELEAGHYSADLDTSTLASAVPADLLAKSESDLSSEEKQLFYEAQRPNFEGAVRLTIYTRLLEAILGLKERGIQVALNGEVGEVGSGYIHPEELEQFLIGYRDTLGEFKGLSAKDKLKWIEEKYNFFGFSEAERELIRSQLDTIDFAGLVGMSAGIGTAHGGKKVKGEPWNRVEERVVNLELVARCRQICEEYGLAGPIAHGVSSLPSSEIQELPAYGAVAAHLATYLHDIVFSHPAFPTGVILELFGLIRAQESSLYNKEVEVIDRERTAQIGSIQYKKVTMGTIIEGIEVDIKAGNNLNDEQRKQVAWIAYEARGKSTALRAFIDLKRSMWDIPREIQAELRMTVRDQVIAYMELLNSQGTDGLIKDMEFPIPPPPPMPEALRDYLSQSFAGNNP